ncbi:DNA-binding protein [Bremerella cremea]|uniref:DNA-binding protein n=1 Tax=Bremerella cremea TaxID=1031537 RepID=A0A368KPY1_9BACT|nr:helix-turn-helix domain-containing protein [Bremerella cremea]RCS43966.1 DNA-binding protein [Bremerella cremea]
MKNVEDEQMDRTRTAFHPKDFLNKEQTAEHFSVSKRTLERWVESGEFPSPFKIGGFCYWHLPALTQWGIARFMDENSALANRMSSVSSIENPFAVPCSESLTKVEERRQRMSKRAIGSKDFSPVTVTRRIKNTPMLQN